MESKWNQNGTETTRIDYELGIVKVKVSLAIVCLL